MARRTKSALDRLQSDGAYSKRAAEKLDYELWDTISLLSTTLTHRFFVNPLGSGGKTLADTNMINAGLLPQGQNMKIHSIEVLYMSDTVFGTDDIQLFYTMLKQTTVEFVVPGKDNLGQWILAKLFGMCQIISLTPTAAGDNLPFNLPTFKGIYPLNYPIKIGAVQSFEVRLTHQVAPNASLDGNLLMISLHGRLFRMS